jgi:hypothetical protein
MPVAPLWNRVAALSPPARLFSPIARSGRRRDNSVKPCKPVHRG